jgi:hypothetical protein
MNIIKHIGIVGDKHEDFYKRQIWVKVGNGDLSVYSAGDHISLKSIAERQNISEGYREQVFSNPEK